MQGFGQTQQQMELGGDDQDGAAVEQAGHHRVGDVLGKVADAQQAEEELKQPAHKDGKEEQGHGGEHPLGGMGHAPQVTDDQLHAAEQHERGERVGGVVHEGHAADPGATQVGDRQTDQAGDQPQGHVLRAQGGEDQSPQGHGLGQGHQGGGYPPGQITFQMGYFHHAIPRGYFLPFPW